MASGWIDATSSKTGVGGPVNVYAVSVGWIITSELRTVSRPITSR